ncbi:hypothetical protein CANARDRAFT_8592 [[Candida] arabinofermentans NRRL YB-2248]|uniref:MIF4G domain-containing protein n=1 Tax=[Candida] arabinofermentans NRRL YB-2248 TaxID=983967 RepID=A0A1E4SYQ3_9ASCO|nr:hypothetical protein CANARDRAFT_8592 [[Candida] arabinofermentans NRRL YB-2248]
MSEDNYTRKRRASVSDGEDDNYEPSLGPNHKNQNTGATTTTTGNTNAEHSTGGWNSNVKRVRRTYLPQQVESTKLLIQQISTIGEHPLELKAQLEHLSHAIVNHLNNYAIGKEEADGDVKTWVGDYLYGLIVEQPHKLRIVASLIELISVIDDESFVGWFVEYLGFKLQELLDGVSKVKNGDGDDNDAEEISGECGWVTRVKQIVRFLISISGVIASGLDKSIDVVNEFLKLAVELQHGTEVRTPLAELLYVDMVLSIPFIYATIRDLNQNDGDRDQCEKLLETARGFEIRCEKGNPLLMHFGAGDSKPYQSKLLIDLILPSVVNITDDELDLFVPYRSLIKDQLPDMEPKVQLPYIKFPEVSALKQVILSGSVDSLFTYQRYVLELFQDVGGLKTVPEPSSYVSLLLRDILQDLIQSMEFNRVTVAKQLLSMNIFFNEFKFAKWNSSLDKLSVIDDLSTGGLDLLEKLQSDSGLADSEMKQTMIKYAESIQAEFKSGYKSTFKMEHIIVNVIFELMLCFNDNKIPNVYYETLLTDICARDYINLKKISETISVDSGNVNFAKTLENVIRFLFDNVVSLDYDLSCRIVDFMLVQLSNFGFEWNWNSWDESTKQLEMIKYHPKIRFIRWIIGKLIRVSNPRVVMASLPESMYHYLNLELMDQKQVHDYDSKFFGEKLASDWDSLNDPKNWLIKVEEIRPDAGNAEIYGVVDQYHFNDVDHGLNEYCHLMYENIQEGGENLKEFQDLVKDLKEKYEGEKETPFERYLVTLVVQSTCIIGSRSLSVIEGGALELCNDKLKLVLGMRLDDEGEEIDYSLFEGESDLKERQKWLIGGVLRLWNREPRVGYLVLEKFMNRGFVTAELILESLFENSDNLVIVNELYGVELFDRLVSEFGWSILRLFVELSSKEIDSLTEKLNSDSNNVWQEIYSEEFEKMSEVSDNEGGKETELKWGLRSLVELTKSKLRQFHELINLEEIEDTLEKIGSKVTVSDLLKDLKQL